MNPPESLHTCKSCGQLHDGFYCSRCGEKVLIPRERTLVFFFSQLFQAVTFAETKLWRSLRLILLSPGQYACDFSEGRRVKLMQPINLFLLANLIYFIFPIFDTFNTSLKTQMYDLPSAEIFHIEERVLEKSGQLGMSLEAFEREYNQLSSSNSKLLLIVLILFFAVGFAILNWKRRPLLWDHLNFALEYGIYQLVVNTILFGYITYLIITIASWFGTEWRLLNDLFLTAIVSVSILYFLVRGMNKYYRYSWMVATLFSILTLFWSYGVLQLYRWLLFEVTFVRL